MSSVTVNSKQHQSPHPWALNTHAVSTMAGQGDGRQHRREIAHSRGPETGLGNDGMGRLEHSVHHWHTTSLAPKRHRHQLTARALETWPRAGECSHAAGIRYQFHYQAVSYGTQAAPAHSRFHPGFLVSVRGAESSLRQSKTCPVGLFPHIL